MAACNGGSVESFSLDSYTECVRIGVLISAPGAHARQASAKKHPMRYNGSGSDGMTDTSLVRA